MSFCTYLTIYSGNKLPPFYVGSTSVEQIANGYHGSIRSKKYQSIFKAELKQNPHLFKTKIIKKYYSRKMALYREKQLQIKLNVVRSPMYFNQSIATVNGMFGRDTSGELHPLYNVGHTLATRKKLSDNHHDVSGANNPRAKHIRAISPDGTVHDIIGGLKKFCVEHKIGYSTVLRMISKEPHWRKAFNGSTTGWMFNHMN